MNRLLIFAALLVAFIFLSPSANAARPEFVSARNISSFALFRSGRPGDIACRAKGSERKLGRLTFRDRPSLIVVGAEFKPLSPSIAAQERRLRKQISSGIRALKRPRANKAVKQAQRRLQKAQRELTLLTSYVQWCNTFVPLTSDTTPPPAVTPPPGGGFPEESTAKYFIDDSGDGPVHTCSPTSVSGTVSGNGGAIVTLANDSFIESQNASSGSFSFPYVPAGVYTLTAESEGASFGPRHTIKVRADGDCPGIALVRKELPDSDAFAFRWKKEKSLVSGLEQTSLVIPARAALGADSVALSSPQSPISSQSSAAEYLALRFKVNLDSSELSWGAEHAERLRQALDNLWPSSSGESPLQKNSYWVLTSEYLPNDIQVTESGDTIEVKVTAEAFRYAALTPAELDGVRGSFFSERLSMAAARFLTRDGRDRAVIEQIFTTKFRIVIVNDLNTACSLTYSTSRECGESFQLFSNNELLQILPALAQLPDRTSPESPFVNILRRRNGVRHPSARLNGIRIVPYSDMKLFLPYIEFSADAFLPPGEKFFADPRQPTKELLFAGIVAANAQMLWDRVLTQELRDAWIAETGWTYNSFTETWSNSNPTEVGAMLAAGVPEYSPKGDFATSVAKYVASPEELRFRSDRRFEFLKLYIMHGLRYSRQFREDLKFPVLNLRPDFSYPGEVNGAEVVITGKHTEDKTAFVTLTLEGNDPLEHGASYAHVTLRHRTSAERLYLGLAPRRPDPVYGTAMTLQTVTKISKYLPGGFYDIESITTMDGVGNTRFETKKNIGFRFFLKNVLEKPEGAKLDPASVKLSLSETIVEGVTVPMFTTEFKVTNPEMLTSATDAIISLASLSDYRGSPATGFIARRAGDTVRISRPTSPFLPSSMYGVSYLVLSTLVGGADYFFSLDGGMQGSGALAMPLVEYENSSGDVTKPEVDLNSIRVSAQSLNPSAPNGATKVVVRMRAKDDLSGLHTLLFCLRSPLDRSYCGQFDLKLKTAFLPEGTTELKEYEAVTNLPAGSAPGNWGVDWVYAADRVGNITTHQLSEVVKFIVDNRAAK